MTGRTLAWLAAAAALVAVAVLRALDGDHTAAYRAGAFVGAVAGSLVVAFAVVWLVRRVARRRDGRAWSPLVPALAALVGLVVLASDLGDAASDRERDVEAAERCAIPIDVFGRPPAGLAYGPLDAAEEEELRAMFPVDRRITARMRAYRIVRGNQGVGVVMGLPLGASASDLDDGFVAGAREQGVTVERFDVAGREVLSARFADRTTFVGRDGCVGVMAVVYDERVARVLPRALFGR